jgi:hypothetical protein
MSDEAEFLRLDIVWDSVSGISDIVAAVDSHPITASIPLLEGDVADDASPILFRSEFEVLTHASGDDFEILCEIVALVL